MARRTTRIRSSRRAVRLDFGAIEIIGGLLTPDIIGRIAAFEAQGQDDESYRVPPGLKIRDEIARYFRIGEALWAKFAAARAASPAASEKFALDLLQQCFGFDTLRGQATVRMGEREFPVRHAALEGRVPVVIAPVPPATARRSGLDESLQQFGDGTRRRSATLLIQEYLNAADDCLWGLTLDGATLRLMRDNVSLTRPAWIEADLEKIFSEGLFPDFSALFLLIHQSRFGKPNSPPTECSLEQWRDIGRVEGVAARDKLRRGVEAALVELGQGFIEHQANGALRQALTDGKLSRQAYFEELLRLVYRMIFLFAAEDRELLHAPGAPQAATKAYAEGYSIARLRERCMRRTAWDRHGDAWEGLKATFAALGKGEPRLGLPALGGLFASDQLTNLTACKLENRRMLAAVWRLAWMRPDGHPLTRVNWRDMETEELGSVYESLLELTPIASADTRTFTFAEGDETRGNARKVSGSYYTPDSLVQALLDESLNPLIEETVAGKNDKDAIEALLNLRIIDPACGSGHFLLAAARRLASRIARLSSPGTPSEADFRHWLREVSRHCLFGIDRNPMAIQLAKVALWIETVEPGKPLSFLDAHLRWGDALLGVYDLAALQIGIPDDAYKPLIGDDKKAASAWKARNKSERDARKQGELSFFEPPKTLLESARALEALAEDDLASVQSKASAYRRLFASEDAHRLEAACDLYVAAFLLPKTEPPVRTVGGAGGFIPTSRDIWDKLDGSRPLGLIEINSIAASKAARAFHWPLEFPQVFYPGAGRKPGFDLAIGNPPWERIKLQEHEFFASRDLEIANAPTAAARRKLISALASAPTESAKYALFTDFNTAKRTAEAVSSFVRTPSAEGGRFPFSGTGDVNTYALFAELFLAIINDRGRAGSILPTGIATDASTSPLFAHILAHRNLCSLLDFENRDHLFPGLHTKTKFCILSLSRKPVSQVKLCFMATKLPDTQDRNKIIAIDVNEFSKLNPNTHTSPIFRSVKDAELTTRIYSHTPVLKNKNVQSANGWDLSFTRLYDMTNDSSLFSSTRTSASARLYEAKMFWHFDHRWASFDGEDVALVPLNHKSNPSFVSSTRHYVPQLDLQARLEAQNWDREWLLVFRNVSDSRNERTFVATIIPACAVGNSATVVVSSSHAPHQIACLLANFNSLVLDYVARQKVPGMNVNFFMVEQFPVLPPSSYTDADLAFIVPRVLELTFTATDLSPWAKDLNYHARPFVFDLDQRCRIRAELDAYYAKLYKLKKGDLSFILDPASTLGAQYPSETFRVLIENEMAAFGEYRTSRLVLDAWDRLERGELK